MITRAEYPFWAREISAALDKAVLCTSREVPSGDQTLLNAK